MSDIRHIAAASGDADLFATAAFEHDVCVWSRRRREQLAAFPTVLDFGGRRLCLVPTSPWVLVAAAYHRDGVCAYDPKGRVLWQRRDLKHPQDVEAFQDDGGRWLLAVGREQGSLTVVDALSGETNATLRGVREIFGGAKVSLHVLRSRSVQLVSTDHAWNWSTGLVSFAVLDAAFSPDEVAFSEAGGNVRCFTLTGKPRWTWEPGTGVHALRMAWEASSTNWLAVVWPYERGGPWRLVRLSRDGQAGRAVELGGSEHEFLGRGEYVVSSDGRVREPNGQVHWQFVG